MNVLVFSLYLFFISFLDFMSRLAVVWISSPEFLMFVTFMPCLYVLLCGPKIRNKDSCILYLGSLACYPRGTLLLLLSF